MFGRDACKLISELHSTEDLQPFNETIFRQVLQEINSLCQSNVSDVNSLKTDPNAMPSIVFRHAAMQRNKQCVLAYLYNRMQKIRDIRWEMGSILPPEVSSNFLTAESQWFLAYNKSLASYMRSIGEDNGLNLTINTTPPKSLFIEVKCLTDFGKLEIESGEVVTLKKNTYHLLPRADCEPLIRQGILEHHNT